MKNILLFLFLVAFSISAVSQELPVIDNLSKLNTILSPLKPVDKNAAKVKDFSFTINPYLWTIAIGGTVGVPNIPSQYPSTFEFNRSFSDNLKKMKMALIILGKLKYKRVNLFYDIVYANLKGFGVDIPAGAGILSANTSVKEFITDLSLGYSFPTSSKSTFIDAYAGVRIWSVETGITLLPTGGESIMKSTSNTWVDPIVGVNVKFQMSEKWFSYIRSDFGGFNANSDYNFMILGGFGYKFSPHWNTSLGLKNLSLDYNKDGMRFNVNQYGFIISVGYNY